MFKSHTLRLIGRHYVMIGCFDRQECWWFWNPAAFSRVTHLFKLQLEQLHRTKVLQAISPLSIWDRQATREPKIKSSLINQVQRVTFCLKRKLTHVVQLYLELKQSSYKNLEREKQKRASRWRWWSNIWEESCDDRRTAPTCPVMELGNLQSDGRQGCQHHLSHTRMMWLEIWAPGCHMPQIYMLIDN